MDDYVTDQKCSERSGEILSELRTLNCRLFQDNGTLSVQTRLDRHEQSLRLLCRLVYGAVGLTLTTVFLAIVGLVIIGG